MELLPFLRSDDAIVTKAINRPGHDWRPLIRDGYDFHRGWIVGVGAHCGIEISSNFGLV